MHLEIDPLREIWELDTVGVKLKAFRLLSRISKLIRVQASRKLILHWNWISSNCLKPFSVLIVNLVL